MAPVKVNKVTAFELNGVFFPNMLDAEIAVRRAVIMELIQEDLDAHATPEDVAQLLATKWNEVKRRCDEAFKGI